MFLLKYKNLFFMFFSEMCVNNYDSNIICLNKLALFVGHACPQIISD